MHFAVTVAWQRVRHCGLHLVLARPGNDVIIARHQRLKFRPCNVHRIIAFAAPNPPCRPYRRDGKDSSPLHRASEPSMLTALPFAAWNRIELVLGVEAPVTSP
jgi:hypothetical protein